MQKSHFFPRAGAGKSGFRGLKMGQNPPKSAMGNPGKTPFFGFCYKVAWKLGRHSEAKKHQNVPENPFISRPPGLPGAPAGPRGGRAAQKPVFRVAGGFSGFFPPELPSLASLLSQLSRALASSRVLSERMSMHAWATRRRRSMRRARLRYADQRAVIVFQEDQATDCL